MRRGSTLLSQLSKICWQHTTKSICVPEIAASEPALSCLIPASVRHPLQCLHIAATHSQGKARILPKGEEQMLRWPLPLEELTQRPELAKAMIDDDSRKLQQADGNSATFDMDSFPEYQKVDSKYGGFVKPRKRRRTIARPPPPVLGKATPSTCLTPDDVAKLLVRAHARDCVIIDVSASCAFADSMIICTGQSSVHVQSLSHAVLSEMKAKLPSTSPSDVTSDEAQSTANSSEGFSSAKYPFSIEGGTSSEWSVVDAGSMVVHVLTDEARHEYDLESLWAPSGALTRVDNQRPMVQTLSTMRVEDEPV